MTFADCQTQTFKVSYTSCKPHTLGHSLHAGKWAVEKKKNNILMQVRNKAGGEISQKNLFSVALVA